MVEAVCLGELLIDFVSTTVDVPLGECPSFVKAPGGAPANVAVGLSKLGVKTGFVGRVGDDPFGHFLRDVLAKEGVDTKHLKLDTEARTTLAFIANRTDWHKEIAFYRNPGADQRLSTEDIDGDYIRSAKLFHFGSVSLSRSPSREATMQAARLAKDAGLLVSYDPNWRPPIWDDHKEGYRLIWEAMPLADVVHIAEEEWEFITGTKDLHEGSTKILETGVHLVVATLGERGCFYCTQHRGRMIEGFKVEVVDTLGAGDAFVAAMLYRLLQTDLTMLIFEEGGTEELDDIMTMANAAGALTCTKMGVIPALPTREELERFYIEHTCT